MIEKIIHIYMGSIPCVNWWKTDMEKWNFPGLKIGSLEDQSGSKNTGST